MNRSEAARLGELASYGVLDTAPEEAFDRLTALAAEMLDAPIALVSLIDADRQWFKSRQGLDLAATARRWSFSDHAIRQGRDAVMVVEDAAADPRFSANPLVTGAVGIRFYAGAVLTTPMGYNLGTLCVLDTLPRPSPSLGKLKQLRTLARIVVDELELRRANREAHEKNRMLDLAESLAGVGRWRFDVATGRITWSDAVYAIHGVTRAAFDPNRDDRIDFYHPDDRETVAQFVQSAIAAKGSFQYQVRLNRPGGEERHVISKGACDLDAAGEVVALFGVFQDITDQVRSLQDIRHSEAQYRLLAENASDLIMRSDEAGQLTYVSPAAAAVTGYGPEEMLGRRWSQFVCEEDAPRVEAALLAQLAWRGGLAPKSIEYRARHRDGHELWLEGRPTFAVDPVSGEAAGVTDVVRDISAHKEDEEELRKARVEAEAAVEIKSQFLANMSHELRTPLTAVLGFSGLIGEQPGLTPATRGYLHRISTAGQVLLATVNDVLDFSKLESGKVEIKPAPVSPAALAGDMLDLFTLQAADKALDLRAEGLAELPATLLIDSDRVRQILLNLIGNAIKFTAAGQVRLEAGFEAGRLSFAVVDSGPGIAPEDAGLLFRRFSQIDGSTTRRHGGAGLGLAICKGLVEAMGGEIGLTSQAGQGARFWFSIPAAVVGGLGRPAAADPAATEGGHAPLIPPGCRVLLAEDNQVNRALVRTVLETLDVELTEARDGLEAVDAALAMPFDVILMDLRMPRLDGVAATRRIRSEDGPNICSPIIAFSADAAAQMGAGLFDALVGKPLSAGALIQAMADVMAPQYGTGDVAREV
jgi:PAS domain S-box-containing protein